MELDWQNSLYEIKNRGQHLLQTEKWSDCRFLVGTPPNSRIISGHKLILAMASPVFERMFYGNLPPDKDPIEIPDVQPDAFMGMLEYIYSDRISINSFDKACELCYVAKKYMLPYVVESCTAFLWDDLSPKNACRAYEFAKLFDEPRLMHSSMEIISKTTKDVLQDPNFTDVEPSTLMSILDQDKLNVDSELDLFNAVLRYANDRVYFNDDAAMSNSQLQQPQGTDQVNSNDCIDVVAVRPEEIKMEPDVAAMVQGHDDCGDDEDIDPTAYVASPAHCSEEVLVIDSDASAADGDEILELNHSNSEAASTSSVSINNVIDMQRIIVDESIIRQAIKKIRFLTLSPQQFAEGPARSKLLKQDEALAILIKISSPSINDCPMPAGFCSSRCKRGDPNIPVPVLSSAADRSCHLFEQPFALNPNGSDTDLINTNDPRRSYCIRTVDQQYDFRNTSVTDCGLTFQVDTNIWIIGVQVPTQVLCGELMNEAAGFPERYTEILYAHLQDIQGSRLTYTHCTSRVRYDSYLEISFDRPIYIYRNQIYKIYVVFNKIGWYPMYTCVPDVICNRVKFMFNVGNPSESVRDGLIRAIVFTVASENSRPMFE